MLQAQCTWGTMRIIAKYVAIFLVLLAACLMLYIHRFSQKSQDLCCKTGNELGRKDILLQRRGSEQGAEERRVVGSELTILGWTPPYNGGHWTHAGRHQCGQKVCSYTQNHALLNVSEAVIIKPIYLVKQWLPKAPSVRYRWQKWIAVEIEPPPITWREIGQKNVAQNFYNVTALPIHDADVYWNKPRKWVWDKKVYEQLQNVSFTGNKTKLVAWFVSHCKTASDRETYVKRLQEHIPVDVYGRCGPKSCRTNPKKRDTGTKKCDMEVLHPNYKFYLSFENSLCEEYITEKVTRIYQRPMDIVPVVMGHANYSKIFPPGSYIDVRDFGSEKQLADYLIKLDKDPAAYNEYVRRKRASVRGKQDNAFCSLCTHLHKNRDRAEIAGNVAKLYGINERCLTPRQFFTDRSSNATAYRDFILTPWD